MDVYLDLSLLLLLIEIMVCIYGSEVLLAYRYKRRVKFFLILGNLLLFFTYKLTFMLSISLFIIVNILIFVFNRKKWISESMMFFILFFIINFFITLITDEITLLHIYLMINNPLGIIYALLVPLFGVGLYISMRFVDAIFHLHSFKTKCIIRKDQTKGCFLAYFDSGNTLKVDNVPVIFCIKSNWLFPLTNEKEITVETINGMKIYQGYEALISIEDSNEEFFVYVVLNENLTSFNGCEVLLNAYLR